MEVAVWKWTWEVFFLKPLHSLWGLFHKDDYFFCKLIIHNIIHNIIWLDPE